MESKLFIDGKWCDARNGGTLDVVNPANGRVFHRCAAGTAEDIDAAVAAAKAAMAGPWSWTTGHDRAAFLRAIGGGDRRTKASARRDRGQGQRQAASRSAMGYW